MSSELETLKIERDALAAKLKEAEKEREMFIDRDRQSWEIRRDMHKENVKLKDQLTAERARSERLVEALKFYSSAEFPWSADSEYDNGAYADEVLEELAEHAKGETK